jgi:poly-gamma-glutamate capsule biosynthesis protein CapA/YwtB (metallophosphatase superfamily)
MSAAPSDPQRAERGSKILVLTLVSIFLFSMFGFAVAVLDARGDDPAEPAPPSLPAIPVATPLVQPEAEAATRPRILLALAETSPVPAPSPSPSIMPVEDPEAWPVPVAEPVVLTESAMPIVPVARFWSKEDSVRAGRITKALETGEAPGFKRVIVEKSIADTLAAELGIEMHDDVQRGDAARVERAVSRGALGLIAAVDVTPAMRMLAIDGVSLTGNERIKNVSKWPLSVSLELPQDEVWDQRQTWVLVAGGDSFTDRGVYDTVVRKGKGVDYPFDGGTARVTGHGCCDPVFNDNVVPRYVLTGNKGLVRKLFKNAELAIANHEQPVTESAAFHTSGTRFSGKPALTKIFTRAGIDFLSLANNHIGDYGSEGIKDTRRILRQHDIAFGGAGKDLEQARRVHYLDVDDTRVAIIPCLDIVKIYWAGPDKAGATPCVDQYIVKDIKRARRDGDADVVIVFPHWGVEYTRQPLPSMRKHAARWVKAGANLVLGGHSHVAGSIEDIDGSPVLYSLGNLIFDQHWSTNTMESALLEATFHGDQLVEMRLRPYIIHGTSQPNLLDPDTGEGRRLIKSIQAASSNWLDW